ncbi:hypothetical protein M422DRAFT_192632 [Sphaerobolus stellatus SS14]|uniref:F-box domain-containing protein n=1 Tax=Sphaerobolus stellatus (strain SS14) TaxID=990650 RepID=A0A0C9UAJ0_SPHS4|nr:hypothetical protein M422DRAFT_192632 [Sphaerobolus stellatus SS14]
MSGFFTGLAFELIEYIINSIGDVNDLLSLALTCRAFSALIIPWHIEYRWISCDFGRKSLWKTLSGKPFLVSRLQTLKHLFEHDFSQPAIMP